MFLSLNVHHRTNRMLVTTAVMPLCCMFTLLNEAYASCSMGLMTSARISAALKCTALGSLAAEWLAGLICCRVGCAKCTTVSV